jgi:hypothetical protein
MITWAVFAMLITASPIFAWRHALRQDKKKPADPVVTEPQDAVPPPAPAAPPPHAPHAPQQRPSWAASNGGNDQNMQIALGGLGGRKE